MDPLIAEIIEEVDANRAMFVALVRACTPHDLAQPLARSARRVLDVLAEAAAADQVALHYLTAPDDPAVPRLPGAPPFHADHWASAQIRWRSGRDVPTLLREMTQRREECLALLEALRPGDLDREVSFPGDTRRSPARVPLRLWLRTWSKQDMLRAQEILHAVPDLAANADFRAWLADDPYVEAAARSGALAADWTP